MNFLNYIRYSKCPNCKKHGIKAFFKTSHGHNPIVVCKYCQKKYTVNIALTIFMKIFLPVSLGLLFLCLRIKNIVIPFWIIAIVVIIAYKIFEYFAPLEEHN